MNLTEEQIQILSEVKCHTIFHFDHHVYTYDVLETVKKIPELSYRYKFIHDKSKASTLKLYEQWPKLLQNFKHYSECVNAYDLWLTETDEYGVGYALNDLFWEYKSDKFFSKFKDKFKLDTEDKQTLLRIKKERDEYVKNTLDNYCAVNENISAQYIFNPAGMYTNHFTLLKKRYKYYVILKEVTSADKVSYSVRLYNPEFSLTIQTLFGKIKEMGITVISAGGHETVGSILFPTDENEKFLEAINYIFENY